MRDYDEEEKFNGGATGNFQKGLSMKKNKNTSSMPHLNNQSLIPEF